MPWMALRCMRLSVTAPPLPSEYLFVHCTGAAMQAAGSPRMWRSRMAFRLQVSAALFIVSRWPACTSNARPVLGVDRNAETSSSILTGTGVAAGDLLVTGQPKGWGWLDYSRSQTCPLGLGLGVMVGVVAKVAAPPPRLA